MMWQTLLGYKLPQALDNPDKLTPNSWAFCYLLQLTKHPETRGEINEKTISIRVSGFVLTYGECVVKIE